MFLILVLQHRDLSIHTLDEIDWSSVQVRMFTYVYACTYVVYVSMYVCMYVSMYVCMYVCMYDVCMYVCMYICISILLSSTTFPSILDIEVD